MIENYKFKYRSRGKFIFVPTEQCKRKGQRIIKFFSKLELPDTFFIICRVATLRRFTFTFITNSSSRSIYRASSILLHVCE